MKSSERNYIHEKLQNIHDNTGKHSDRLLKAQDLHIRTVHFTLRYLHTKKLNVSRKNTSTWVFLTALFTIVLNWKQVPISSNPSLLIWELRTNNWWFAKRNKLTIHITIYHMNLKIIMLRKIWPTLKSIFE